MVTVTTRTTQHQHQDERRRKEEEKEQQHRQQQQQQRQVFVLSCGTLLLTSILAVTAARLASPLLRRRSASTTMRSQGATHENTTLGRGAADDDDTDDDAAVAAGVLVVCAVVTTIHTGISWVLVWRFWCFPSWPKGRDACDGGCPCGHDGYVATRSRHVQRKVQQRQHRTAAKKLYILHRRELRASMAITVGMIVLGCGSIAGSSFALAFFVHNNNNHHKNRDHEPSAALVPFVLTHCGLYSLIALLLGRSYLRYDYPQCNSVCKYLLCTILVLVVVGSIGITTTLLLQKQQKAQDYWWLPPMLGMVWGGIIVLMGMSSLCRAYLVRRVPIDSVTWWQGTAIYQQAERKYGPDDDDEDDQEEEDYSEQNPEEQDLEEDETTEELSTTMALCRPRQNIPDRGVIDNFKSLQLQTNRRHQCEPDIASRKEEEEEKNAKAVDEEDWNVEDFRKNIQHEFQILGGGGSESGTTMV